jgi:hypothetical protein
MAVKMRRGFGKPAVTLALLFQNATPDPDPDRPALPPANIKDDRTSEFCNRFALAEPAASIAHCR